jgi:hypothetical protein
LNRGRESAFPVTAVLSSKECKRAVGMIKAAVTKVLTKRKRVSLLLARVI